jgi:type IV pilus assembly protein PilQ
VPLLSRIPILGWLFKKKAVQDDRTELLIFITPRIVNRSQSVVAAGPSGDDAANK